MESDERAYKSVSGGAKYHLYLSDSELRVESKISDSFPGDSIYTHRPTATDLIGFAEFLRESDGGASFCA